MAATEIEALGDFLRDSVCAWANSSHCTASRTPNTAWAAPCARQVEVRVAMPGDERVRARGELVCCRVDVGPVPGRRGDVGWFVAPVEEVGDLVVGHDRPHDRRGSFDEDAGVDDEIGEDAIRSLSVMDGPPVRCELRG